LKYRITSRFGQQESFRDHGHSGIDFAMQKGETIRSIKEGIATVKDYGNLNAGKTVLVKWDNGETAIYGHLNDFVVKNGQRVQKGDILGHAGNTGHSTGNHLHFGLKDKDGHFTDPSKYIEDIQNMNAKQYVQHVTEVHEVKMNFFDYMQQHMNAISDIKMNLVHLTDNTLFIQISKQLLQFISAKASFLNDIIGCIF
jgi:hypothetical protein